MKMQLIHRIIHVLCETDLVLQHLYENDVRLPRKTWQEG